jgi:putative transcriptional regulator
MKKQVMSENGYTQGWYSMSDQAIIRELGVFVKETRLKLNYTQNDLAEKAGVHRVTISEFEHGLRSVSLITFIELLRALGVIEALEVFKVRTTISPLQIAKLEAKKRQRASSPRKKPVSKGLVQRNKKKTK